MMNILRKLRLFTVLVLMIFSAAGCDGGNGEANKKKPPVDIKDGPISVSVLLLAGYVDPWEGVVVIEKGQAEIFYAEVFGSDFPEQDEAWKEVSWSITGDVADEIDLEFVEIILGEAVRFTVPDNAEDGSIFFVRATSVFDEGVYDEARITVGIPVVTGICIANDREIAAAGESVTFEPEFYGTGRISSPPALVWEITERLSFENAADEVKGYLAAAGTGMEGNTLIVDPQELYGTIEITCTIQGTNYSASVQVLINETGDFPLRPPR
jgi:hypothetical protein